MKTIKLLPKIHHPVGSPFFSLKLTLWMYVLMRIAAAQLWIGSTMCAMCNSLKRISRYIKPLFLLLFSLQKKNTKKKIQRNDK